MRCEMAQEGRLPDYSERFDRVAMSMDEIKNLDDVIKMALRVDASRKSQANQFVRRRGFRASI